MTALDLSNALPVASAATLALCAIALAIESAVGYPQALFRAIGHPVTWIGRAISAADVVLNRETDAPGRRKALGVVTALAVVLGAAALGVALQAFFGFGIVGLVALGLLTSTLIAQRSLHAHVADVAEGLERSLDEGRAAVSKIVGRDPAALDEAGVSRAAIESLAENFSDGIVAPAFWTAILGLPGALGYKAANTLDSMIGHKNPRHLAFGWASARFDDLINLPASRLSALFIAGASLILPGASAGGALRCVARDAKTHRSPNAGWPEAAMAGALGLKLNGPRSYGGVLVEDGFMGDGRREATAEDVRRALALYRVALMIQFALVAGLALIARA